MKSGKTDDQATAGVGVNPTQAKRAAPQARRRQRWKPKGRDANGGSMRSTRARPGYAGGRRKRRELTGCLITLRMRTCVPRTARTLGIAMSPAPLPEACSSIRAAATPRFRSAQLYSFSVAYNCSRRWNAPLPPSRIWQTCSRMPCLCKIHLTFASKKLRSSPP